MLREEYGARRLAASRARSKRLDRGGRGDEIGARRRDIAPATSDPGAQHPRVDRGFGVGLRGVEDLERSVQIGDGATRLPDRRGQLGARELRQRRGHLEVRAAVGFLANGEGAPELRQRDGRPARARFENAAILEGLSEERVVRAERALEQLRRLVGESSRILDPAGVAIEDRELTEVGGEVRVVRPQPCSGELDRLQVEGFRLGGVPLEPVDLGEVQVADRQVRGIGRSSPFAKRERTPGQSLGFGEVPLVLEEPREIILEPGEQRRCRGAQPFGACDRLPKRTFRVDETVLLAVQLSQRVPRVEELFDVIAGGSGVHANRFGEGWFGLGESPLSDEHDAK